MRHDAGRLSRYGKRVEMSQHEAVLIRSFFADIHAFAVAWGLKTMGCPAEIWVVSDFPARQRLSISLDNRNPVRHRIRNGSQTLVLDRFTTVWNRRVGYLSYPDALHEADRDFVEKECRTCLDSTFETLCPEAFWVNSPRAFRNDALKPRQLAVAVGCGLTIPPTLVSNDPEAIAAFYEQHDGRIIYKSFHARSWRGEDGAGSWQRMGFTERVARHHLQRRGSLAAAPGIYQREVSKAFDVRATFMGSSCLAVRLTADGESDGVPDWRSVQDRLHLEPVALPESVYGACRRLMADHDLVFGCFDFAVTPDGDYVFLEVNQMGQFLWKEELRPDLPLLDMFCRFLRSRDRQFVYEPEGGRSTVRFSDFLRSPEGDAYRALAADPRFRDQFHRISAE